MAILVINAGSSSHKVALFDLVQGAQPLWRGQLDWTAPGEQVALSVTLDSGQHRETLVGCNRAIGLQHLLNHLWTGPCAVLSEAQDIQAVGHRVVHGGDRYQQSVQITPTVTAAIRDLIPLAPAHNPANLEGIEVLGTVLPHCPQVAVFDTAFHAHMPAAAATYPGPYRWRDQGIRRYGFHGISHRYVAQRAAAMLGRDVAELRLVTCHLGNGCSLAAVRGGLSIDTTMGFTPLEGLMMGSRSGSVDPGLLIYLLRQGTTVDDLDHLLNHESGLKGISGVSNDLREVLAAAAAGNAQAQLAIEVFIHSLRRHIGAMVASLGGLDALVFTAGIGENSPQIWQSTCEGLGFLGVRLVQEKLARSQIDQDIAAADSPVRVLVIHTQEEWAIAQDCGQVLGLVD